MRANRYDPHIRAVRLSSESEDLLDDWLVQSRLTFTAGSVFSNLPCIMNLIGTARVIDRYNARRPSGICEQWTRSTLFVCS